jgi:hypothetical protein
MVRWTAWLLVAACSGTAAAPVHPEPQPVSDAAQPARTTASERECDELITHAVVLGIDERSKETGSGDPAGSAGGARGNAPRGVDERSKETPPTTAADHEAIRRKLHEDFMAECRGLSHEAVRCAIAAPSLTELTACQSTRSSSTSNSKVAPGGITPPAPRSP